MSLAKLSCKQELGSIMLMVLMLFLIVSFLGFAAIALGLMEYKSSRYDCLAVQAQQAVDAGVDWGLENIYTELTLPANLTAPTLPAQLTCSNQTIWLNVGDKVCEISVGEIVNQSVQADTPGSCTYEYTVTSMFKGACRKVTVQAVYYFTGGYQFLDSGGDLSFMTREYINRGQIVYYQTLK